MTSTYESDKEILLPKLAAFEAEFAKAFLALPQNWQEWMRAEQAKEQEKIRARADAAQANGTSDERER